MISNHKVIERIRKLLAMSDAQSGASEQERLTALKRVNSLMTQHGLALADIEDSEFKRTKGEMGFGEYSLATVNKWEQWLWSLVAHMNGCIAVTTSGTRAVEICGTEQDRELTGLLGSYLVRSITSEAKALHEVQKIKARTSGRRPPSAQTFKTSFGTGAAMSINDRLDKINEERKNQSVQDERAMVVVKRHEHAIDAALAHARKRGVVTSRMTLTSRSASAFDQGREFGSEVSLDTPSSGNTRRLGKD